MATERELSAASFARDVAALSAAVERSKAMVASSKALLARQRAALRTSTDDAFAEFESLLDSQGIRPALAYVLSLSDYRFIGIFRFKDGKSTSVVHVDKEAPDVLQAGEVPEAATYCSYIKSDGVPFATADASVDPRTGGHPAKDIVIAYCGVPVVTPEGDFIGTLCHYDLVPRDAEQLDLELLVRVSSALTYSGKVPDYPDL